MQLSKTRAFLFATLTTASGALAQGFSLPSDLQPGDQYRVLFVTASKRDSSSTDIADYNAFVSADAAANPALAALSTTWTAVASTATVEARDNTNTDPSPAGSTGVPIYRPDGTRLADDYDHLWNANSVPLYANPSDEPPGATSDGIWTGSYFDGLSQGLRPLGTAAPILGRPWTSDRQWCYAFAVSNTLNARFYGMSAVLTVPSVQASEVERLGTPPNESVFLPGQTSAPILGQTWDPRIDHTSFLADATMDFAIIGGASDNVDYGPLGTLLCKLTGAVLVSAPPGQSFSLQIPNHPFFAGVQLCVQGASSSPSEGFRFANALDITIGTL